MPLLRLAVDDVTRFERLRYLPRLLRRAPDAGKPQV